MKVHRKTYLKFMSFVAIIVSLALSNVSISTAAAGDVKVFAVEIEGLHQKDGKGEYDSVLADVGSKISTSIDIEVLPPARSFKEFESCTDCCISPANKNPDFYEYADGYIESVPMNTAKIYIWSAPGSDVISGLSDLKGKKVGIRSGMPYGNKFESASLDVQAAPTIEANIRKLKAGRIDAFIAYVPDAWMAFESEGIDPFPHDAANPISVHPDAVLCKQNEKTESFVAEFNKALGSVDVSSTE